MPSNINLNSESASNIETPDAGRKRLFLNSDNSDHLTSKDSSGQFHDYDDTSQRTFNILKSTAGTLAVGSLVYLVSQDETDNVVSAELAKADSESTMNALCVVTTAATDLVTGQGVMAGTINEMDTSSFTANDPLYVSSAVAGAFTNVVPVGTEILQHVGTAGHIDGSDGTIVMHISGGGGASSALAERVQATGLLEGGVISEATSTTVDWTTGHGQVVDYTDPEVPVITDVTWSSVSGRSITGIATDGVTLFGYDSAGAVVERLATAVSILDAHNVIWFGQVFHVSSAIVEVTTAPGNIGYGGIGSFADFMNLVIGPANIGGNIYGANGANLNIDVLGGPAYMIGSNFRSDPKIANIVTLGSDTATSFRKTYQGGALSVVYDGVAVTAIEPDYYDNAGSKTAMTATYWQIQRIYRDRNGDTFVAYGQQEFATKTAALAALGSEAFTEQSPLTIMLFRCSLVVQEGATDLSDTAEAEFFIQSSFRLTGAVSASATIPGVTNPGGIDGAIQYNDSNTFGGDSNYLFDSTLKAVSLEAPAAGSATYEFYSSTPAIKGALKYTETGDTFELISYTAANVLTLQDTVYIHKGAVDGRIDVEAVTGSGCALLTLSAAAGGTGLEIAHDDAVNDSMISGEIGNITIQTVQASEDIIINPTGELKVGSEIHLTGTAEIISDTNNLIIGTDGSNTWINISPDSATGFKKVPTASYVFDIYAAGSDIVGLYSEQGVTLETGTYGNATSVNFIFNKGDEGTNVSEFAMFNDSNATELARYFRMSYADQIATQGGLNISDQNNFVGIGTRTDPDSPLHVYQDDTETGDECGITIEQDGTGDAVLQWLLSGGQRWVAGIANAGGDAFEIASSINLGSNTRFIINTTGEVKIPLSLMIGSESNPESELHVVIDSSDIVNWDTASGLILQNTDTTDDNYTLIINKGASDIASGILFKNDDHSANYGHMVFSARDANGFEENALTVKPAHIEIANSTNTPYGGSGVIENLLTYSEQIDNAIWQTLGSNPPVVVANDTVAPNGETTADKVTISGGAGYLRHNVTLVEDDTYMLSFWAKKISGDATLQVGLEVSPYVNIEITSTWKRYHVEITAGASNLVVFRSTGSSYYLWGVQLHAGTDETPYIKTEATAFDTATHGASVDGDLVVTDSITKENHEVATKGPEVVEVWSLDDMPRVGGTGDVIPEYKLYRFMQEIDWGTTRLKLENDAYALFEGTDVFVTSQTYSGTDPWIYGEGTIRCVGNGMTWKITANNSTMFDITSGGWGMDYSTLMTTGDNCSLGTITAPSVTNPLLGARFISTRSLFQGFKTGLTIVNPGNIHIDVSFFHDSTDAVGPMLSVIGLGKAGVIESTEVTMSSATSDFLYISPITEAPVTCLGITLADEQSFFTEGDTGDITLFADASVSSESVTSVSDNSGTARFNFSAPPTLYVGQKVTMSSFTNYDNGTFVITATGAGYYETGVAYNIADTGGSFTSDSVTVTSATHGLSELDAVLICCTMEYNHGSTIYNVQTNTFQVNTPWHTAETTGEWNDGSLDHTSKYVTSFNNGAQQNSHPAPSFNVADNATTTSTTTSWGAVAFGTTGSAIEVGNTNQNFVLLNDVTGLIRYEGLDPLTIKMNPSISMLKSGGGVEHQFRLFKTTGTPAFDPHTVKRTISTSTGAASLNCSAYLNPGDEFRLEVKATTTGSTITISDFSL